MPWAAPEPVLVEVTVHWHYRGTELEHTTPVFLTDTDNDHTRSDVLEKVSLAATGGTRYAPYMELTDAVRVSDGRPWYVGRFR
jgi:hypothetical protein